MDFYDGVCGYNEVILNEDFKPLYEGTLINNLT